MYLFYIDETGTRDPDIGGFHEGKPAKDWLYVLTAIGISEHRWRDFYRAIIGRKRQLLARIKTARGIDLDLDATEIKSNWIRITKERERHPFLSHLTNAELRALVYLYYGQLAELRVPVISVVIDKRVLRPAANAAWLHVKAWELLREGVQRFMSYEHVEQKAIMVADDMGKQQNCALAMRHARFLEKATSAGRRLSQVVEMPLFVRSELSEGVQLADLCGYSIYRAFRDGNLLYDYFRPVFARLYRTERDECIDGLKIFPPGSRLRDLLPRTS